MKAIAAMCENRVIGFHGKIPWKNPIDMRFFKEMTWDQNIIVGNTTFEKVGLLKNRYHFILSERNQGQHIQIKNTDTNTYTRVAEYLTVDQLIKRSLKDAWVIGGAKVYTQLLPLCSDLYMTFIVEAHEGDTYMPMFEHMFDKQRIIYEGKNMWIVHYWKYDHDGYEEAYREGFDAGLMDKSEDENPHELSHHERDTTYSDECNYQWSSGWDDAPYIKGLNHDWK